MRLWESGSWNTSTEESLFIPGCTKVKLSAFCLEWEVRKGRERVTLKKEACFTLLCAKVPSVTDLILILRAG